MIDFDQMLLNKIMCLEIDETISETGIEIREKY